MADDNWDTAFVVGTGAEHGSWEPITEAILDVVPNAPVEPGNRDHANFFMAELIAVYRGLRASEGAVGKTHLSPVPGYLDGIRKQIASRLSEAASSNKLQLHPEFVRVCSLPEWGSRRVFLTTNWDFLLKTKFPSTPITYVHGSVNTPAGLYLPSDYAFDPAHHPETQQEMFKAQDEAIRRLRQARTVCIYGLGLDPLDGELAAIIHTGLGESNEETDKVVVYNLAAEQKKLIDRLELLLFRRTNRMRIEFRAV